MNIQASARRHNLSKTVLIQLVFVNVSNIICWLPSSIVLFSSLLHTKYPIQLLFWVVLVLTPTNSIINPCVLVFPKLPVAQKLGRCIKKTVCRGQWSLTMDIGTSQVHSSHSYTRESEVIPLCHVLSKVSLGKGLPRFSLQRHLQGTLGHYGGS